MRRRVPLVEVSGNRLRARETQETWPDVLRPVFMSPEGTSTAFVPSPNHGRSLYLGEYDLASLGVRSRHLFVKGGGLTLGTVPYVYLPKHGGTYYGLCAEREALREWRHGLWLEQQKIKCGNVLAVFRLGSLPDGHELPSQISPCVVFSAVECPFRLGDVAYLNDAERADLLASSMEAMGARSPVEYLLLLAETFAANATLLHSLGAANRTLYAGNITCFGELVDFEAVKPPPANATRAQALPAGALELYNAAELLHDAACLFSIDVDVQVVVESLAKAYSRFGRSDVLSAVFGRTRWNNG